MFSPSQLSRDKMVLWLLLTSDCSIIHPWIGYQVYLTYESDLPRSKRNLSLHLSAPSTLYDLRQKGFCFVSQTHPVVPSLIWSLCSSDRRFAARFLQISRHREHPCVKLTVTSVFTARDLHPIDYAHAGRTSSRWEWLTPDLSHHRTYRSVYGGSIKIVDVKFHNVLISFGALGNSNRNSQGFCVVLDY